jgi:DNA-binding HxlR family transcriptional regulator
MATTRTYGEGCAAAHALDLVGERWALLIVRELLLGPKRFTDLKAGMPGASPNVLSQRLRELEQNGVVRRRKLAPPAGSRVYELTEWGAQLEPAITALGRWGARSPSLPLEAGMSVDSFVLALRTVFDPAAAGGFEAGYELHLGEDRFRVRVADGRIEAVRGHAEHADATIEADHGTLAAVLWGGRPLADAEGSGDLRISGDRSAAERLLGLFPLPRQAAVPAAA